MELFRAEHFIRKRFTPPRTSVLTRVAAEGSVVGTKPVLDGIDRLLGVEMLDEDKAQAGVGLQMLEQVGECLQAADGSADADEGETGRIGGRSGKARLATFPGCHGLFGCGLAFETHPSLNLGPFRRTFHFLNS